MIPPAERVAWIEATLREAFDPEVLELRDDSALHRGHAGAASGGGHYHVTIVSERFQGQSRIARHRMLYAALGQAMQTEIHALGVSAFTTAEFRTRSGSDS